MRIRLAIAFIVCVILYSAAQPPAGTPKLDNEGTSAEAGSDQALRKIFEAKIKVEWEVIKNKDKKAYAELLADDFQGVEIDGRGERTKIQMINELPAQNVYNYTLWGFKLISLEPGAVFVIYESTVEFPPKSHIRYSRVYVSELWVKKDGQWKEVHYQETRVT